MRHTCFVLSPGYLTLLCHLTLQPWFQILPCTACHDPTACVCYLAWVYMSARLIFTLSSQLISTKFRLFWLEAADEWILSFSFCCQRRCFNQSWILITANTRQIFIWHSRQWQIPGSTGGLSDTYRIAPQLHPPVILFSMLEFLLSLKNYPPFVPVILWPSSPVGKNGAIWSAAEKRLVPGCPVQSFVSSLPILWWI